MDRHPPVWTATECRTTDSLPQHISYKHHSPQQCDSAWPIAASSPPRSYLLHPFNLSSVVRPFTGSPLFHRLLHITLTPLLVSPSLAVLHLVHTMQISTGYCTLEYGSYSRHISIIALPTYERYCIISPPPPSVLLLSGAGVRSIPERPERPSQGKSSAALRWSSTSTIRQMP